MRSCVDDLKEYFRGPLLFLDYYLQNPNPKACGATPHVQRKSHKQIMCLLSLFFSYAFSNCKVEKKVSC
jgi:hypothetical protein